MNLNFTARRNPLTLYLMALLFMPGLGACSEKGEVGAPGAGARSPNGSGRTVELTLTGYNYTNREIASFSVNSTGGGNLYVSSPSSGGGGSTCCVTYVKGAKTWKVLVRWQVDACAYDNEIYSNGERGFEVYRYFKETEVEVDPSVPAQPEYLEVHFYPDGHVEAAITEVDSAPRLKLPKERENNSPYRTCPNDERPKE